MKYLREPVAWNLNEFWSGNFASIHNNAAK